MKKSHLMYPRGTWFFWRLVCQHGIKKHGWGWWWAQEWRRRCVTLCCIAMPMSKLSNVMGCEYELVLLAQVRVENNFYAIWTTWPFAKKSEKAKWLNVLLFPRNPGGVDEKWTSWSGKETMSRLCSSASSSFFACVKVSHLPPHLLLWQVWDIFSRSFLGW